METGEGAIVEPRRQPAPALHSWPPPQVPVSPQLPPVRRGLSPSTAPVDLPDVATTPELVEPVYLAPPPPQTPYVALAQPPAPQRMHAHPESFRFNLAEPPQPANTAALDRTALALAIVLPPVGLVASLVARAVSNRRNGWTTALARRATGISAVLSLCLAGAGAVYWDISRQEAAHAALVAQTQPLCRLVAEYPATLEDGAFGWPPLAATIPESIESMKQFAARWAGLVSGAPDAIAPDITAVADAALLIVGNAETSRAIDHERDLAQMRTVAASSAIPAWVSEYCN